jgi:hypothetical protein
MLTALGATALLPGAGADEEAPMTGPTIDDLAWLAGRWTGTFFDGEPCEEAWLPPLGGTMIGTFRALRGGRGAFYEILVVEVTGDGLVLRMRHFDGGLEPWASEAGATPSWPLVSIDGQRAVFEDAERPFPQRQVYERDGDRLTIRLEGEQQGRPHAMAFSFQRLVED